VALARSNGEWKLSVVIAYLCKDFSIIATDTLVTHSNGYQEESNDKIMQIYEHGMGFMSGTGSAEVKKSAYNYIKNSTERNMDNLFRGAYRASYHDGDFANIVVSYMTKNGPRITLILSNGDFGPIEQDRFLILPPSDILEDKFPAWIIDSLEYEYDGNYNGFLIKLGELFSYFSDNSSCVSSKIRYGLHYYFKGTGDNIRRREGSHPHVSAMINNATNKAYEAIEHEVNTHTHYKY